MPDPLHPFVDELLKQLVVSKDGLKAELSEKVRHDAERRLRGELRADTQAFLHLAVIWADMHGQKVEPAAEQILRMLEILPDIQDANNAAPAAERAHGWLDKMRMQAEKKPSGAGLQGKTTLGSVGLRKKP